LTFLVSTFLCKTDKHGRRKWFNDKRFIPYTICSDGSFNSWTFYG